MSNLLVRPGQWNSIDSSEVESFLTQVAIMIGLTEKRKNFLFKIHEDIHGSYTPDEFFTKSCENLGRLMAPQVLQFIMKDCNDIKKKQLKIWYQELLAMEPMDDDKNPFLAFLLPPLSNTIDKF